MSKTKIEEFVLSHGLTLELVIKKNYIAAMLYDDNDLLITSFVGKTVNDAIEQAVSKYNKGKIDGGSEC